MGDDLVREFLVASAHPAALCARTLAHRADLLGFLKVFALSVEAAAQGALVASIAKEAMAVVDDVHHGGHLHAKINAHDALIGRRLGHWQRVGYLGYPFAPLALDTQATGLAKRLSSTASNGNLPYLAVLLDRDEEQDTLDAPSLVVHLADGLAQHRDDPQILRSQERFQTQRAARRA